MWSVGRCLFLVLLVIGYPSTLAQEEESLNFCDIPCVNNIYKFYCGEAKCTTGASDYGQIFQLCTASCAAAVAGEAMGQCLTTTVPDRADWPAVQISVVQEIVEFCAGYEIEVDASVTPLSLKDTDKELLDTLYDEPEVEKEKKKKKKKEQGKKNKKGKGTRSSRKQKVEDKKDKSEEKKSKTDEEAPKESKKERSKTSSKAEPAEPERKGSEGALSSMAALFELCPGRKNKPTEPKDPSTKGASLAVTVYL